jgi:serine/threonine-protein kinase
MARGSKKTQPSTTEAPPAAEAAPQTPPSFSPASVAALVALGVLSSLWALVLWSELVMARMGGTPFCTLDAQLDCLRVWDSPFAAAVHRLTGVPVAGWGLAWGLVAAAFPLLVLLRSAEGRPPAPALLCATRLHAAAGLLAVFVLAAVSLTGGALCLGCLGTYVLVGGYAGIALFGWSRVGLPDLPRASALAAGAMLAAFLLVLYPGTRTPRNLEAAGREAIQGAVGGTPLAGPADPSGGASNAGASAANSPARPPAPTHEGAAALPSPSASPAVLGPAGTGDPKRDARLAEFINGLPNDMKQALANTLAAYRESPALPTRPPRALLGPANAPVHLVEFTDALCPHCATLHETLADLRQQMPGSFSVDSRHYPLDGRCNANVRPGAGDPVRCVAAFARVCMEKTKSADDFATAIFANQRSLTLERVYELGAPFLSRPLLEACVKSEETQAKVAEDVAFAATHHIEGTPLVLVNGRRGSAFPPFLFSIILSGGRDRHPAFDALPKPDPLAHAH